MKTWTNVLGEKFELYRRRVNAEDIALWFYTISYGGDRWTLRDIIIEEDYITKGDLIQIPAIGENDLALESSRTKSNARIILALYLADNPEYLKYLKDE